MATVYRDDDGSTVEVLRLDAELLRVPTRWPAWMCEAASTPEGLPNHVSLQGAGSDDPYVLLLDGEGDPTLLYADDYIVRRPCGTLRAIRSKDFQLVEVI